MKKLLLCVAALGAMYTTHEAAAQVPDQSKLTMVFNTRANPLTGTPLRIRVVNTFPGTPVPPGTSCVVELSACISPFAPRNRRPNPDERECEQEVIGSAELTEGNRRVDFIMNTFPIRGGRIIKQVSFQTQTECSDDQDAVSEFDSAPRAKKITRPDGVGVLKRRFLRTARNDLRTIAR